MGIVLKLKSKIDDLSKTEKKIANFIIDNIDLTKTLTSSELAEQLEIGQSTIIKFVKKFGFKGFTDFKMCLIEYSTRTTDVDKKLHNNISIESDIDDIYLKLVQETINSLNATYNSIDKNKLKDSIDILNNSNRVMVAGIGASSIVAKDMYYKILKVGKNIFYNEDMHISYQIGAMMDENDVCIIVSYSGKTEELLKLVNMVKKNLTKVIVITSNENSPIAKLSDVVLQVISEEGILRTSAMSSRITQLSIVDILFLGLLKEEYDSSIDKILKSREVTGWSH
ncbi:MAG: MurR/RpiR family transcriptional regulator [Romboutsia sp.]|uniref:MurR/RpiR family transcriptional regulator n=1 Tax=Romboutsia sp. TaxID=1965302 RepID=UPI003F40ABAE